MPEKLKTKTAGAVMNDETAIDIPVAQSQRSEPPATTSDITDEMIAERAYSYWAARDFKGGSPEEDWYRAIEELTATSRL